MSTVQVYVIYDGDPDGPLDRLAHAVADGVSSVDGASVLMHTTQQFRVEDMVAADAIILGSPNWHGMTADLKQVIDQTGLIWEQGRTSCHPLEEEDEKGDDLAVVACGRLPRATRPGPRFRYASGTPPTSFLVRPGATSEARSEGRTGGVVGLAQARSERPGTWVTL